MFWKMKKQVYIPPMLKINPEINRRKDSREFEKGIYKQKKTQMNIKYTCIYY